ncbi:hypothetical protein HELRODRAFT_76819 [Helobdella robusta]|uniref:SWI/SNF-like complex subunit BAF250 C-terminal domain-containing protein n=1 Tax=Helobdella robusta TaxID=6412 RepID=T1G2P7_HELRO|nr:hypothetical protein HELRODRAFT_76819 [Helobdella robusta]ESO07266.1 hypothetical protein HELRODRAFT_76819 [Helobdella robusta]
MSWYDEVVVPDEGAFCNISTLKWELISKCLTVMTIVRNISFVIMNDVELSKHPGLILVLAKLLRLNHKHRVRQFVSELDDYVDDEFEGDDDFKDDVLWWSVAENLRENSLVILANISGQLDLTRFPEEICIPLLDGLLHWMVCQTNDPNDDASSHQQLHQHHHYFFNSSSSNFNNQGDQLTFRRLALESLSKLCVLDSNVDLLLATPPFSRTFLLVVKLVNLFEEGQPLVVREMSVGLISRLLPADPSICRILALQRTFISSVVNFIESCVDGRLSIVEAYGQNSQQFASLSNASTSIDVLYRVAVILKTLSEAAENKKLVARYQQRLLMLATSSSLHKKITSIISSILYTCI